MQTFLPYPNFSDSAECLDNKRLGKQRVECKQLLLALGHAVGPHSPPAKPSGWSNHPAVKMWCGYETSLALYGIAVCVTWRARGYKDSLFVQFGELFAELVDKIGGTYPPWLGDDAFHRSHQSNLLRKDPVWYGQFGWAVGPELPYVWPITVEV